MKIQEYLVLVLVSLALLAMLFPSGIRNRADGPHTACRSNLKNIASAIDNFADQHNRQPTELESLTPDYLRTLPTCPAVGRMTYTLSTSPGSYRISCQGRNHPKIYPEQDNAPFLNSDTGLSREPRNPVVPVEGLFFLAPLWLPLLSWLIAIPLRSVPRQVKVGFFIAVAAAGILNFPQSKLDDPLITLGAGVVGMALLISHSKS